MRVKQAVARQQRHKSMKAAAKGMQKGRRRSFRLAKQAVTRSFQYAYRDRRARKRDFRRLWIQRINAAARLNGTTYSQLMSALKKNNVTLDRKVLSQIAFEHPDVFASVVKQAK